MKKRITTHENPVKRVIDYMLVTIRPKSCKGKNDPYPFIRAVNNLKKINVHSGKPGWQTDILSDAEYRTANNGEYMAMAGKKQISLNETFFWRSIPTAISFNEGSFFIVSRHRV